MKWYSSRLAAEVASGVPLSGPLLPLLLSLKLKHWQPHAGIVQASCRPQTSCSVKKVSHVRSGDSRAKYCDVIFSAANTQQITMFFDIYLMVWSIMLWKL